jgi:hypothetical protein
MLARRIGRLRGRSTSDSCGCFDSGHADAINEAVTQVNNDLRLVVQHCMGVAGAAAAVALAAAALEKAAELLALAACAA